MPLFAWSFCQQASASLGFPAFPLLKYIWVAGLDCVSYSWINCVNHMYMAFSCKKNSSSSGFLAEVLYSRMSEWRQLWICRYIILYARNGTTKCQSYYRMWIWSHMCSSNGVISSELEWPLNNCALYSRDCITLQWCQLNNNNNNNNQGNLK